jgi:hypothetical protein
MGYRQAAENRLWNVVKELIEKYVNVDVVDKYAVIVLYHAVGNRQVVE